MLWLPTPLAHSPAVAIADRSAVVVERVILSESPQVAASELAEGMLADGWFVVWVQSLHGGPTKSILELAEWLAENVHRAVATLPTEGDRLWQPLSDWDARGLAAGGIAASRWIDPAGSRHWRSTSPDYVARLMETLRHHPTAWPDDADQELHHYLEVDSGIAWRLPRLIARLRDGGVEAGEFERRVHQARLEGMKELAYGASHEVNNPLANIAGRAQMLLKEETDAIRRRMLHAIKAQAMRAHEMISDLMHFARPSQLERQPCCLGEVMEQVREEWEAELAERRIRFELAGLGSCGAILADGDQIQMALRGVVQNAMEAIGVEGQIAATLERASTDRGAEVAELTIADTGRGIPEEIRPKLFDPFFSGREAGRGLGFGLAKAWRIVTDHGGTIELVEQAGYSAAFRLRFPLADPSG